MTSALKLTQSLGLSGIELIGESAEVVLRANNDLSTGYALRAAAATFLVLTAETPSTQIHWIKPEQNLAGIVLAARHPR